jgi:hypothetical protein
MKKHVLLLLLLVVSNCFAQQINLISHDKKINTFSLEKLREKLPEKTISVFDPHENKIMNYNGFSFKEILKLVYGDEWQKNDEILFECMDGYDSAIPTTEFLSKNSFLVYAISNVENFVITNRLQDNKQIYLSPFYLIWDLENSPNINTHYWPYQVETIDLINFKERFPNMIPSEKSSTNIQEGFVLFRQNCMTCHSINGEGGTLSFELNYPVSVTEYFN